MSEELRNLTAEEDSDINDEEVIESGVEAEDLELDIEIDETVEIVEVEPIEEINIEMEEAIGWVGGDSTKHYSLYGRDEPDQHPITAITGLREELNDIEALDVVYSNERNQAHYYLWQDENVLQENRIGYFVNIRSGIDEIAICTSENDIFGVTVDKAGFIGAQSDIARDVKYGLVVTTGAVRVRCEASVDVGDYVVSNDYGYAQKNKNGYKVVGRHRIDGVEYAEIILVTPIGRICELSNDVDDIVDRMDDAETNIVAAMNVANAAYNKANEVGEVSEEAIKNALEALDKADSASEKIDRFESRLEDANETAVQAKAIAESATVSAEAIRQEAVAIANQALSDVSSAIEDLDAVIEEVNNSINDADAKAQLAVEDLVELQEDMRPLAEWKDDEGNHSFAGFVARADEDSAILSDMMIWQGTVEDGSIESIAGLDKRVSDNEAALNIVADYKKENSDGTTTDGFAGLISQVDENESNLSTLASYSYTEDGKVISSGLSGLIQQVGANASSIKMLVGFEDENVDSLGEIAIKVNANESAINSLTSWQTEASATIASTEQIAKENQASITSLTNADTELKNSMTEIKQQSDANGASIELLAASVDKYSVGEYSQSYGLTHEQANNILKDGMIYVPTKHQDTRSHSETFSDTSETNEFTPGAYYIWNKNDWVEYGNSVAFFSEEPTPSRVLQYWYIDSNEAPEGYEAHALYIWKDEQWQKVNILDGNVNNRLTSMIRQTADEISAEVINARGGYTGLDMRLDDTDAQLQMATFWNNPDSKKSNLAAIKLDSSDNGSNLALVVMGNDGEQQLKGASIVLGQDDGESYIALDADNINLEGYTTINGTFSVDEKGYMIATGGTIGGWTIEPNALSRTTEDEIGGKYNFCLLSNPYSHDNGNPYNPVIAVNYNDDYKFYVRSNGYLYAKNAEIEGKITATDGKIGCWDIEADKLYVNTDNAGAGINAFGVGPAFWAGVKGDTNGSDAAFHVFHDGRLYASLGRIAGWNIDSQMISNSRTEDDVGGTYHFYLQSNPYSPEYGNPYNPVIAINYNDDYKFYVRSNGELFAKNATIVGNSNIAGWNISDTEISKDTGNFHFLISSNMYTDGNAIPYNPVIGVRVGNDYNFFVRSNGDLYAKNAEIEGKVTATSGTIGGCSISDGTLHIDNANINSLNVSKLTAGTNNKAVEFTNIAATGGEIGDWGIGTHHNETGLYTDQARDGASQASVMFSPTKGLGIFRNNAWEWVSWYKIINTCK